MLITPRPGANRENLLEVLRTVHTAAMNTHNIGQPTAYSRLLHYLEWGEHSARRLRNQIRSADLTELVLTPRHDTLLNGSGTLPKRNSSAS